jgi:hypothetical protein
MKSRYLAALALVVLPTGPSIAGAQNPNATPPADAAIVAQERAVLDALVKPDTAAFNRALGSDFVYVDARGPIRWERAKTTAMLMECPPGQWSIDNPATTKVGNDLVVLTYTTSGDQTCSGQKRPSPVYSMSVWQMRGGRGVAVAHSETPAAPKQ